MTEQESLVAMLKRVGAAPRRDGRRAIRIDGEYGTWATFYFLSDGRLVRVEVTTVEDLE